MPPRPMVDLCVLPSDDEDDSNDRKQPVVVLDERWKYKTSEDEQKDEVIQYDNAERVYRFTSFLPGWCTTESDAKCKVYTEPTLYSEHGSYKTVKFAYSRMIELTENQPVLPTPEQLRNSISEEKQRHPQLETELKKYRSRQKRKNYQRTEADVVLECITTCIGRKWLSSCVFGGVMNHWAKNQEFVKWDFLYPAQNQFYFAHNAATRFVKTLEKKRLDYHLLDYLFMFVNDPRKGGVHSNHWQLVVVNYPEKQVQVYNPIHDWPEPLPTDALISALTTYDKNDLVREQRAKGGGVNWGLQGRWTTKHMNCLEQRDNYNCGVFCLVYCYYLIHGLSVPVDGQREFENTAFMTVFARHFITNELYRRELEVRRVSA